jgi:hypothetical protein
VTDALHGSVHIFAGEFLGIGTGVRVWRTIGITFKGDGDDRTFRKPLFQTVGRRKSEPSRRIAKSSDRSIPIE